MIRYIALVVLVGLMLGLAVHIERTARPIKNVNVQSVHGEGHDH
jgi:hypothetical protein